MFHSIVSFAVLEEPVVLGTLKIMINNRLCKKKKKYTKNHTTVKPIGIELNDVANNANITQPNIVTTALAAILIITFLNFFFVFFGLLQRLIYTVRRH